MRNRQAFISAPHRSNLRRRLRLRQLELLAMLEQASSLSGAARALGLSQPAASRLLIAASRDLGVQLFERAGRMLRPTPAGRALIRRAARLMGDLDRAQDELDALREGRAGTVALGAGVGASYALVPAALAALLDQTPGIGVALREGPIEELLALLRGGRLDMVVGRIDAHLTAGGLTVEPLYDPPIRIVAGVEHPLARARHAGWRALLAEEWILPQEGTPTRAWLEAKFREAGGRPARCQVESSSIPANVGLLAVRRMLWVLSSDIATRLASAGSLAILRAPPAGGSGPLVLVLPADRPASPAAQRLGDCVRAAARRLGKNRA